MKQHLTAFESKYSVHGKLSNSNRQEVEIQADITINDIGINPPMVTLRGHRELKKDVLNIIMGGETRFTGEWIQDNYAYKIIFISDGILDIFWNSEETDVICYYNSKEIELDFRWKVPTQYKSNDITLSISYSLPKIFELSMSVDLLKQAERFRIPIEKMKYETAIGQLSILPSKISDLITIEKRIGSFQYTDTLIHFESDNEHVNHDDFLKQADAIVGDYLDVISMIAQRRIQYYKTIIQYYSSDLIEKYQTHKYYYRSEHLPNPRARLIEWQVTHQMLKEIMPKYSRHNNKPEIHHTLNLFLTGVQSEVVETKLIWLQNAIEVVIEGLDISTEICKECGAPKKFLKHKLFSLANSEPTYFIDIYPTLFNSQNIIDKPDNTTFPFIKIRNGLSHGDLKNYSKCFVNEEIDRQQLLLERLLCKWIGIDHRKIPYLTNTPHIKQWSGIYS